MKGFEFDLKRALAGDALQQGDGTRVRLIGNFPELSDGHTLVGIGDGELATWKPTGRFRNDGVESICDLRMVTDGGPTLEQEMVQALNDAHDALRTLYNVTDYPADGHTEQDHAMQAIAAVLAKVDANVGS